MNCPEEWEEPLDQHCRMINVKVSKLDEASQLWQKVNTQFE
jgi:cell division protein ZapA (FtsZ GTPase activity inhibitor)